MKSADYRKRAMYGRNDLKRFAIQLSSKIAADIEVAAGSSLVERRLLLDKITDRLASISMGVAATKKWPSKTKRLAALKFA